MHLELTRVNDLWPDGGGNSTGAAASALEGSDNFHGLCVSDLAENDVLSIEPGSLGGGDEELRAVAT